MPASRIDRLLGFEHGMPPAFGIVAVVLGLGFLFFGWRLHRVAQVVAGFAIGSFVGALVAGWIHVEKAWGIFIGGASLALLADSLSKLMVFLLAGLAVGLAVGEGVRLWLQPSTAGFLWGFVLGFLAGGIWSWWQRRLLTMVATAFLGAVVFAWGLAVALTAFVDLPLTAFPDRHPTMALAIVSLLFVGGLSFQLWGPIPRQREEEE